MARKVPKGGAEFLTRAQVFSKGKMRQVVVTVEDKSIVVRLQGLRTKFRASTSQLYYDSARAGAKA